MNFNLFYYSLQTLRIVDFASFKRYSFKKRDAAHSLYRSRFESKIRMKKGIQKKRFNILLF